MNCLLVAFVVLIFLSVVALARADENTNTENPETGLHRLRASKPFSLQSPTSEHAEFPTHFLFADLAGDDELLWRDLMEHPAESMSMSMDTVCPMCSQNCLPPNASPFDIMGSTDIGDTKEKGKSTQCGPNCYVLKGSGQDVCEDEDRRRPDALHFAYTKVSGPFILAAQVCGPMPEGLDRQYARTGLMIRENLDPMAKNMYLSHTPNYQAKWSYRTETNGETFCSGDGSPDVPCLWLFLQRLTPGEGLTEFIGYYFYDFDNTCNFQQATFPPIRYNGITFPDEVYVGMAVLYGRENELYGTQFNEIHFADKVPPTDFTE
jgi:hypothetical protein